MKKIAFILISLTIIAGILYWRSQPEPLSLLVSKVEIGTVEQTVSNTRAGTIKACRRSKLSMPLGGVVNKLHVKKGDAVKTGQLLLELSNNDRYAAVDQAKASLEMAKHNQQQTCVLSDRSAREAKRAQSLLEQKLIAIDIVDNAQSHASSQKGACDSAKSQVASAQAQLAVQQAVLAQFQLHAPFDGVIAEINGEIGEYVTPSPPGVQTPPAVDLIDTSCLYATAPIDEIDAAALRLDMPVNITLDAFRHRTFAGKLHRIAPYVVEIEKQARTVDVDVRFDEVPSDVVLLIGYSADVTIVLNKVDNVLRVPSEALFNTDEVWTLDINKDNGEAKEGKLSKHKLKLGIGNFTYTEIISGVNAGGLKTDSLKEGTLIVRNPDQPDIIEGAKAMIRPEKDAK